VSHSVAQLGQATFARGWRQRLHPHPRFCVQAVSVTHASHGATPAEHPHSPVAAATDDDSETLIVAASNILPATIVIARKFRFVKFIDPLYVSFKCVLFSGKKLRVRLVGAAALRS